MNKNEDEEKEDNNINENIDNNINEKQKITNISDKNNFDDLNDSNNRISTISSSPTLSSPHPLPLPLPLSTAPPTIAQQVHTFYLKHNPTKLDEIPKLLEKYKGQETELLRKLEKKYGVINVPQSPGGSLGSSFFSNSNVSSGSVLTSPSAGIQTGFFLILFII